MVTRAVLHARRRRGRCRRRVVLASHSVAIYATIGSAVDVSMEQLEAVQPLLACFGEAGPRGGVFRQDHVENALSHVDEHARVCEVLLDYA